MLASALRCSATSLKADFLGADDRFALADLVVQILPAQGRQLRLELALFALYS
jgi:hypothetical protein